jgi:hypothetical protein
VPEIVEALVVPLPDGTGTIWIVTHDESVRFDGEHVRVLTGLATFMAISLQLLRLTHQVKRARGETEGDLTGQQGVAPAGPGVGVERAFAVPLPLPLPAADPVERVAPNVSMNAGSGPVAEARDLPRAEARQGTPLITWRTEKDEVLLASRALVEQVRLVLRDGRRLIRRLVAVCETSKRSRRVQMTSRPTPLASVPLVVLRSTTDREQIELKDLVQSLSAEGYQVDPGGPQWVVYTKITDRRKSVFGESPQDSRKIAAMSARVRGGSLRQRRRDDDSRGASAAQSPESASC